METNTTPTPEPRFYSVPKVCTDRARSMGESFEYDYPETGIDWDAVIDYIGKATGVTVSKDRKSPAFRKVANAYRYGRRKALAW